MLSLQSLIALMFGDSNAVEPIWMQRQRKFQKDWAERDKQNQKRQSDLWRKSQDLNLERFRNQQASKQLRYSQAQKLQEAAWKAIIALADATTQRKGLLLKGGQQDQLDMADRAKKRQLVLSKERQRIQLVKEVTEPGPEQ